MTLLRRLLLVVVALPTLAGCHLIFPYRELPDGGEDGGLDGDLGGSDACLPIPAKDVEGGYVGTWNGTYTCPGYSYPVSGTLNFTLSPAASKNSFKVKGDMKGTLDLWYTLKASVSGNMGCSALTATMPDISITFWIFGQSYQLSGSLEGTFNAPAGGKKGFRDGTWTAKEKNGDCTSSGTWTAAMP